jgi:hypothetical protein
MGYPGQPPDDMRPLLLVGVASDQQLVDQVLADRILSWESARIGQDSWIRGGLAVAGQGQIQRVIQCPRGNTVGAALQVVADLLPLTAAKTRLPVLQIRCCGVSPDRAQLNNRRVARPA